MSGEEFFGIAFHALMDVDPLPWQRRLFLHFVEGVFPGSCALPTGLGKTAVMAIWLIAAVYSELSGKKPSCIPRRLVYVVNRRTVVDQATDIANRLRERINRAEGGSDPASTAVLAQIRTAAAQLSGADNAVAGTGDELGLAISTLRGQFADNSEWRTNPARLAIIVGTVDMIGSRLLFSGYGPGFRSRPLHAGFLGQDALIVHDEAHLEPAFQQLLEAVQREQNMRSEGSPLRVMSLTATPRSDEEPFTLDDDDRKNETVIKRIHAKKRCELHPLNDGVTIAAAISELALAHEGTGAAVLVFSRTVNDVEKITNAIRKTNQNVEPLTGTMRGLERDQMAKSSAVFSRFLPKSNDRKGAVVAEGTVYLVCTSAGEVGVDISADHLVCDLSTFESMAQRFGRVNRFGFRDDTVIHVVHPTDFDEQDELDQRRMKTLDLLCALNGNGSPHALGQLNSERRHAAFAAPPTTLPTSDILFDSWANTTIRGKLPGRPPVGPYLHGVEDPKMAETRLAWRAEVWEPRSKLKNDDGREMEDRNRLGQIAQDLLESYPLKPHEILRDNSSRIYDRLQKLKAPGETPVWIVSDDDSVEVTSLANLIEADKDTINDKTLLLPPRAGGLLNGLLNPDSDKADDVADEWFQDNEKGLRRRQRIRSNEPTPERLKGMRLIREINLLPIDEELDPEDDSGTEETGGAHGETSQGRFWRWYVRPRSADDDGSKTSEKAVLWKVHTDDVTCHAQKIVEHLPLADELKKAVVVAAKLHDLGKKRVLWQRSIGNPQPTNWLAKSGGKMKPRDLSSYRHEFGSLLDAKKDAEFLALSDAMQDVVLHLIAAHHGFGRPHFPPDNAIDPEPQGANTQEIAAEVPRRFARLQRRFGRWGLAYLESMLRAADYAASSSPSKFVEDTEGSQS